MKNLFLKIWFSGKIYFYVSFQATVYLGALYGICLYFVPPAFLNNFGGTWGKIFVGDFLLIMIFYPLVVFEGTKRFYRDQMFLYELYKDEL